MVRVVCLESLACSEHAGSCLKTTADKGRQEFCEMNASIFVLHIILPKSAETSIKNISKNVLSCRDGYVTKYPNKMWMALCQQGKDGVKQKVKHTYIAPSLHLSYMLTVASAMTNSSTRVNILHDSRASISVCASQKTLSPRTRKTCESRYFVDASLVCTHT